MKQDAIDALQDTLAILRQGYYEKDGLQKKLKLTRAQMEEARVFLPRDVENITGRKGSERASAGGCAYACENIDSFGLARKRMRQSPLLPDERPILVLNLANPVNPGGGVRRGARAQEEDLCRKRSLLLSLEGQQAAPYYAYNRSLHTYMGSDAVMIHPAVEIIKDETGEPLADTVVVSVMTCAAPMLTFGMEGMSESEYEDMVLRRITGMLKVAAYLGYERLILGAFGCGAFRNDAHVVSGLFRRALQAFDLGGLTDKDLFRRIDFAVLDRSPTQYNFREFFRRFGRSEDEAGCGAREQASAADQAWRTKRQPEEAPVFFWKADEENGCFSNWFSRPFVVGDFIYLHVEQYIMAEKAKLFHDPVRYTAILRATEPDECKRLGKQVAPFDNRIWDACRYEIAKAGNLAKYTQNPDLRKKLLDTGTAILAEASPRDRIWGIGLTAAEAADMEPSQWPGQNLLGRILMDLRDEFSMEP